MTPRTLSLAAASLFAVFSTSFSTLALASADLAQKKACMACHAVDKKVVGPSYQDVAAKYKGQKGAEAMLVQKILKGSDPKKLNWGTMPMPANSQVNEAEAKQLVTWVLSQKK
jgi:cytochrome c